MDIMTEMNAFSKKPIYEMARIIVDEMNAEEGDNYVPCELCHGKGERYKLSDDGLMWECYPCVCAESRKALKYVERTGYLDMVKSKTFESFDAYDETMKWLVEKCKSYVNCPDGWFYLGGQSGFGKTHLAIAMFGRLIRRHRSPRIMLWIQDSAKLKALVTDTAEYEYQVSILQECDILVIDDLFNTKPTQADIKLARTILDYRYINRKPTIITTELMLADLNEEDDAIAGRIAEMCGTNLIQVAPNESRNFRMRSLNE